MAGDWIKVRNDLIDDPAVGKIAEALKLDKWAVAGRLVAVWSWADRQSENGDADVTLVYIDELVSTTGMGEAMVRAKWLEVRETGEIRFPKFDRHMSKSAKKRALTQKRTQWYRREEPVTQPKRKRDAKSVTREEKSISNKYPTVDTGSARSSAPPPSGKPSTPAPQASVTSSSTPPRATPIPEHLRAYLPKSETQQPFNTHRSPFDEDPPT